ncbi:hypothetical protein [Pseudomonas nitroreducens]|uniref:hypothetical protein n=1 Tax=Pseudomonas nitroreducens TaxID=46680 RepID=UPI0026590B9A|nr:hypothetical protein [Pseudomonas nitroreducens]MCP1651639.1 hypothetical protein [Pseudomonas nitroreducens]MCP1684496.1 hypothetical protein [Pseudomonas nitroreducens]
MTDTNKLKELAERADALHGVPSLDHSKAFAEFKNAANPQAILGLIAELEWLRSALQAVHAEVDGNIRPLTRDLVNMVSGVKNGSHPNEIYDHCEEIDRIIDAALEGGGR